MSYMFHIFLSQIKKNTRNFNLKRHNISIKIDISIN
jgi:hypothetical protein